MPDTKKVKLIADQPIWTGTERIEVGEPFEATDDQAKHLIKKGAASEPPKEAKKGAQ